MHKRVLIVGTVPYNKKMTSRAFEAYFGNWEPENLAQVFSNPLTPVKGHCGKLYQITDAQLLRKILGKTKTVGKRFLYRDLSDTPLSATEKKDNNKFFAKLYQIGSRKNAFSCLMRKWLWNKKRWCTEDFNNWLDEFSPECVFLSFSDDFFIPEIALYVAEKYDIPIVSSIGDDYYFNDKFSLNPFYHIYCRKYKKLIRRVFAHGGSAIYIGDKIRDKYNAEFGLNGKTVYLCSEMTRRPFSVINKQNPNICYFGNIRQGRNESLSDIGYALGSINSDYRINVYSGQNDKDVVKILKDNPFVNFCGAISYEDVVKKTAQADIVVIVEGFKKKHVDVTKYSLSTKAADSLKSGASILVYGSAECGVIDYMSSTRAAAVCTQRDKLTECINHLVNDTHFQYECYENAVAVSEKNHMLENSNAVFESVVEDAIIAYEKEHRI